MISESGQYFLVSCPDAVGGTRAPLAECSSLEPQLPLKTREQGTDSQGTAGGQSPLCFLLMSKNEVPPGPPRASWVYLCYPVFSLCEIAQVWQEIACDKKSLWRSLSDPSNHWPTCLPFCIVLSILPVSADIWGELVLYGSKSSPESLSE